MKNYKFIIEGNSYEVSVNGIEDSKADITVNGKAYSVEIVGEAIAEKPVSKPRPVKKENVANTQPKADIPKPKSGGNSKAVLSPLPGVILELKVKQGDTVKKGDIVLIMEAMKMENNISTEFEGVISTIKVSKGQSVMQNDVLVEID